MVQVIFGGSISEIFEGACICSSVIKLLDGTGMAGGFNWLASSNTMQANSFHTWRVAAPI